MFLNDFNDFFFENYTCGTSQPVRSRKFWKDKSGNTLRFKSLVGGTNITLSAAADTVSIAASTNATTKINVIQGACQVGRFKV